VEVEKVNMFGEFKLSGDYQQDLRTAETYHKVDSKRVKLQSISLNCVGKESIQFHYNIMDKQGEYLKTVTIFPQFEDSQLATEKIQAELRD
jgi:hypothetical protein